jgi:immune inhibitor A
LTTTSAFSLSGATQVTLTYAVKYKTEASYDFFSVLISTNGGSTWTTLSNVSGTSSGYSNWAPLQTINLDSYAGQTNVKLRFRFTSDGSVTDYGVALDEVKVVKQ